MGKNGRLKTALQSQQSRLKKKQQAVKAAQVQEQKQTKNGQPSRGKDARSKGKGKAVVPRARLPTIPFRPTDKILLIGEGNFSFARALVFDAPSTLESLPPNNITATAYDSEAECYEKYPDAHEIVRVLKEKGVQVLFGVDGTRLQRVAALKGQQWDRVVFNFPHAGKGITDQDRNILSNQMLILGFLRSAADVLAPGPVPSYTTSRKKKKTDDDDDDEEPAQGNTDFEDGTFASPDEPVRMRGTVLITLRNVSPYTSWDLPRLAKTPPLSTLGSAPPSPRFTLLRSFVFDRTVWKGYEHRMTKGERAHGTGKTGEGGEDRTWEFCLRDVVLSESEYS